MRLRYTITGLLPQGRVDEAVTELERALETDQKSLFTRIWLAEMLTPGVPVRSGHQGVRLAFDLNPDHCWAHFALERHPSRQGTA